MSDEPRFPRLRTHKRVGAAGQVWISYYWDGRGTNAKDIALGSDRARAIELWAECQRGNFAAVPSRKRERLIGKRKTGKRRAFADEMWTGLPLWAKSMFLNAERRAQQAGEPFLLTVNHLSEVIARAGGRCEVSGTALVGGKRNPFSPSVDRMDCSKGYQPGNIRIVCLIANYAMNDWGDEPLRVLAQLLRGNCNCGDAEIASANTLGA